MTCRAPLLVTTALREQPTGQELAGCHCCPAWVPAPSLTLPRHAPLPVRSSVNNTFNIEGVKEHTMFFKTVEDAARLRLRISECFERAALPQTTAEVGHPVAVQRSACAYVCPGILSAALLLLLCRPLSRHNLTILFSC